MRKTCISDVYEEEYQNQRNEQGNKGLRELLGKYLLFNAAAARFVGMPVAAVLGRDDTTLFDRASARVVMEHDRRVMDPGGATTEEEVLSSGGVTRTYLATKAPYRNEHGTVIGVIGISRDITDRKRAEETVRDREAFIREVLDSMSAHVAVLNPEGIIVAVNESWLSFAADNHGPDVLAPRTVVGTNYLGVCDESAAHGCADAATVAAGIRQVHSGTAARFEFEYTCHVPNQLRWFRMMVTDVTDRRRAEQALRESEARFRTLVESLPDAVFLNVGGRVAFCNPACVRLFGASAPDQIVGKTLFDLHPPDYHAIILRRIATQLDRPGGRTGDGGRSAPARWAAGAGVRHGPAHHRPWRRRDTRRPTRLDRAKADRVAAPPPGDASPGGGRPVARRRVGIRPGHPGGGLDIRGRPDL